MYSAGTMLSSRCRLIMDGREVEGQDAVMEVLEELMMQEDVAVVKRFCFVCALSCLWFNACVDKRSFGWKMVTIIAVALKKESG